MRVATGGIIHETNTYADEIFGPTEVDAFAVTRGPAIVEAHRGTGISTGGFLRAFDELGAEVVPLLHAFAQPSGTISSAAYSSMKDELIDRLRADGPVDAVALDLHGAGVVEDAPDLEADLVAAVRDVVGDGIPVVGVFDLHGNVSAAMGERFDLMLACHNYPHTDLADRGYEGAMLLPDLIAKRLHPVTHIEYLPMLLPTSTTDLDPAAEVKRRFLAAEARPGVIDCSWFHGFPYTDVAEVGSTVVCTTDGDPELAASVAREIARDIWEWRDDFKPSACDPDEAVRRALAAGDGPVVINETSDNPGGGTPGDGTHLLRALLAANAPATGFGHLCDPVAAQLAHAHNEGDVVEMSLGGRHDTMHGAPVEVTAEIVKLTNGRITLSGPMMRGVRMNLGPSVLLRIGNVDVIVTTARSQTFDTEIFKLHGIDAERLRVVCLKSSQHFRAAFAPIAKQIITADSPGLTMLDTGYFEHPRAPRPLWPRDADARYP